MTPRTFVKKLRVISANPYLGLLASLVLFLSAGWEVVDTFEELAIGTEHGVLLYSGLNVIKVISEFMEKAEALEEAEVREASKE